MVHNCITNVVNALCTRHITPFPHQIDTLPNPPYLYSPEVKQEFLIHWHNHYKVGAWRAGKSLRKQEQIVDSINNDPARYGWVKSHIKTEINAKLPTKARLIQAFLKLRDNYEFADEYRAFTEALIAVTKYPRLYCGIEVHLRSACGLNHNQIAGAVTIWLANHPRARIFLGDVSNMDGSVQRAHLYEQYDLYDVLDAGMAAHARATCKFRGLVSIKNPIATVLYQSDATVKSGAQDTSSGQTTRRADCFVRCLYGSGVTGIFGFAFGDDLWVLLEGALPTIPEMAAREAACGWKTKSAYVDDPCQSDFLACTFVPDIKGGYAMLPQVGRLIAKLFWTHRSIHWRYRGSYIKQVADAFIPRFVGEPFMTTWLSWHTRQTVNRHYVMGYEGKVQPAHPHPLLWEEFYQRRYGLPPPPPDLFEELAKVPEGGTAIISHWWTEAVMRYDLADPAERQ